MREPGRPDITPELGELAAGWREAWRRDQEAWGDEAARAWEHGRTLADRSTEWMLRGDVVAVSTAGRTFTGPVVAVGEDLLAVATPEGRVDVRTAFRAGRAAHSSRAPVVVRVVDRGAGPGRRPAAGAPTFEARLAELEARGAAVVVGSALLAEELIGEVGLGRDHLVVRPAGAHETVVPRAWVAYVRPASTDF